MVKWLRQRTHDYEAVGSNPATVYWMVVSDASYYIQENNKNIGSPMGHTKKGSLRLMLSLS
jgi:hypothetical protein